MQQNRFQFSIKFLIIAGWVFFEIFNAVTTFDAISFLFGDNIFYNIPLVAAFILADVGALWEASTPAKDDSFGGQMLYVFIAVAIVNAGFTFVDAHVKLQAQGNLVQILSIENNIQLVSAFLSVTILGIRVLMIQRMQTMIEGSISRNGNHKIPFSQTASKKRQASRSI